MWFLDIEVGCKYGTGLPARSGTSPASSNKTLNSFQSFVVTSHNESPSET